jgi:hypothetical protein
MRASWTRRALVPIAIAAMLTAAAPSDVAVAQSSTPGPSAAERTGSGPVAAGRGSGQAGGRAAAAQAQQRAQAADGHAAATGTAAVQAAAAQAAKARAAATRAAQLRAAQRAAQARQRVREAWDGHGRPNRMIIVRATSVDSVTDGALTLQVVRAAGILTPARLDNYVPSTWITTANGMTQLAAALVLSPGVVLDVGGDITTLQLAGGATATQAASIYTGSGRLSVHGVTVTSVNPGTGQPVAPGAGRPFIQVSAGGRIEATDTTFSDLGTPANEPQDRAGIGFSTGSTGALVRTTVLRNSTGVRLAGSTGVRLEGVTVADSAADGLVLQGDQGTTLTGVRAERNGGNGVRVSGPSSDRPITGITTSGNGRFGLAVISQTAPQITGIVTQADRVGGLELAGNANPVVTDFSVLDQPIGVLTHLSSSGVTLDQLRISGGRRGLLIEKTTNGLALTGSTVQHTQTGVSIGGHNIQLRDVLISQNESGVRIERGAHNVIATALHVTGGQDGVVVLPGTTNVVLRDMMIDGVANTGVRTSGPNATILGGRISGSATGIDAQAATIVIGIEITRVNIGIRDRSTTLVRAEHVEVSAVSSGINVEDGSPFVLTDSRVDALQAVNGDAQYQGLNDLSLPPLNLLSVIGIPLMLLALLLDQMQRLRQRHQGGDQRRLPPPRLQARVGLPLVDPNEPVVDA